MFYAKFQENSKKKKKKTTEVIMQKFNRHTNIITSQYCVAGYNTHTGKLAMGTWQKGKPLTSTVQMQIGLNSLRIGLPSSVVIAEIIIDKDHHQMLIQCTILSISMLTGGPLCRLKTVIHLPANPATFSHHFFPKGHIIFIWVRLMTVAGLNKITEVS